MCLEQLKSSRTFTSTYPHVNCNVHSGAGDNSIRLWRMRKLKQNAPSTSVDATIAKTDANIEIVTNASTSHPDPKIATARGRWYCHAMLIGHKR